MRKLQKSPQFVADVENTALSIAAENVEAAIRFIDAVEAESFRLTQFPFMGTRCHFASSRLSGLRVKTVAGFRRYLIYFRVTDESVLLVRLIHGARDQDAVIGDE